MAHEKRTKRWSPPFGSCLAVLVVAGLLQAGPALASGVFVWYDGNQKKKVHLDPSLLAEFGTDDTDADLNASGGLFRDGDEVLQNSMVKKMVPRATLRSGRGQKVRIWKLPAQTHSMNSLKTIETQAGSRVSPVFEDGETGAGRLRALPGNVMVTLNSDWSEEKVRRWIATHHLKIIKRMESNPHVLLIETPAGMESLATANRIYEGGEVMAASPNWWRESVLR